MDVTQGTETAIAVVGVADNRAISLDRLAREEHRAAAESLRHVLPADGSSRVSTAEFGSSV